jgi:simple sugar transport system substrate-binding protein
MPDYILVLFLILLFLNVYVRRKYTKDVCVITHEGYNNDHEFWVQLKKGLDDGSNDTKITYDYKSTSNSTDMANAILTASNNNTHAIILSLPTITSRIKTVLSSANKKNIKIIIINTGRYKHALNYVGMDNVKSSHILGSEIYTNHSKGALLIYSSNNLSVNERLNGLRKSGLSVVPVVNKYEYLQKMIKSFTTFAIITADTQSLINTIKVLNNLNDSRKVFTYDLTRTSTKYYDQNRLHIIISQQQYMQGYMPFILLHKYNKNKLRINNDILTGPSLFTAKTS